MKVHKTGGCGRRCPRWFTLIAVGLFLGVICVTQAQPFWPQFRGPKGLGVADSAHPPLNFGLDRGLVWCVEVPPGHSSPCVWGNRIFLTSFSENRLECRAYDRASGKLIWVNVVPAKSIEQVHPFNNPAAPTAAADEQCVVFYVGSFGLLCYNHDGTERWRKELPAPASQYGSASSPIIYRDKVIQLLDSDKGGSCVMALQAATGEQAWESSRSLFSASWSTPLVWAPQGVDELVVLGSKQLTAYDPATGKERWSEGGFPIQVACSIAAGDDRLYACSAGIGGRSNPTWEKFRWEDVKHLDKDGDGKLQKAEIPEDFKLVQRPDLPEGHPGRLFPFPLAGFFEHLDKDKDGAITEEEWKSVISDFEKMDSPVLMSVRGGTPAGSETNRVVWRHMRGIPEVPSPLYYRGKLYLIRDGGVLQCMAAPTGTVLYQERVGVGGGYSASPIAASGRIYLASQSGMIVVVDAIAQGFQVLARNQVGGQITATPAMAESYLYVRTDRHLLAFSDDKSSARLTDK
jgi:outer membrane protein assembly factor BamB